ncbi:hypothetical protein IAT38_001286 [Cryptococcus sp. DSM 104549]
MSRLSYPQRRSELIHNLRLLPQPAYQSSFLHLSPDGSFRDRVLSGEGEEDHLSIALDVASLQLWSGNTAGLDQDVLHRIEALRLKEEDFEVLGQVGDGQFGTVFAVKCCFDNSVYAMKRIEKAVATRAGLWWGAQMAGAIQWVHLQGFVHRDIKPHNFVVHEKARLLLTDFGSSTALTPSSAHHQQYTVPIEMCALPAGTIDYISPEVLLTAEHIIIQAAQGLPLSHTLLSSHNTSGYGSAVDWWSFGASIYEMATGKPPFWSDSVQDTYELIMTYQGDVGIPACLTVSLKDMLKQLLSLSDTRLANFEALQHHSFFKNVNWNRLHDLKPPTCLAMMEPSDLGTHKTSETSTTYDHSWQSSDKAMPATVQ